MNVFIRSILPSILYMNMDQYLYKPYHAYVTKVYDADTVTCDIELGFGLSMSKQKIRLFGINAIELRDEGGEKARDYLSDLILNKEVKLYPIRDRKGREKKGKYGRWLGIIQIGETVCNSDLVEQGFAVFQDY